MKESDTLQSYLFIAGAPRCGTTFLTRQLARHPKIELNAQVASYFFMEKSHPLLNPVCNFYKDGLDAYKGLFDSKDASYFLDGTDHLMYQLDMIPVVRKLGRVKLVFVLRDPSERIFSSFSYTKNNLGNLKKEVSFLDYADALLHDEKEKIASWFVSEEKSGYVLAREFEYSHYEKYLREWRAVFDKEEMLELKYESLVNGDLGGLFSFLGINEIELNQNDKNESYGIRNRGLHRLLMKYARWIPFQSMKNILKKIYLGFQKDKIEKTKEDLQVLDRLKTYFNRV